MKSNKGVFGCCLMILAAAFFLFGVAKTASASSVFVPAPAALPYYNGQGFTTEIHYVNPTDSAIALPGDGIIVSPPQIKTVAANSVFTEPVTDPGSGVKQVNADSRLDVYSEITTPTGSKIRVRPLQAKEKASFYDLVPPGTAGYNSGIFVSAETDTQIDVGGNQQFLRAGDTLIFSNSSQNTTVKNEWGSFGGSTQAHGSFYAFAYTVFQANGSIYAIEAK